MTKVLITGGSGFIGARVVRQLIEAGRDVVLLLRPASDTRRIDDVLARCTVVRGDLARLHETRAALERLAPTAVLHLAWDGVRGADRNGAMQMQNVCQAIDLYHLTEAIGCRRFVGLGSQAEYGPLAGRISEGAPTRPTTVYGAAKLAACLLLERRSAASDRPFAWLRLFSSYGPDDDPSWLVPYLIRTLLAGGKPSLTRAEQIWDYLHVDDVAAAIVSVLDSGARGVFNLASGRGRPLREIVTLVRDAIDPLLPLGFGEIEYRPDQVMHLEGDISALMATTGWVPRMTLEHGIASTVSWYRNESLHAK
jgi:UDP-glucose 4-epimerase